MTYGDRHGTTKLSDAQIREIRGLLSNGIKCRVIAEQYGVHPVTIDRYKRCVSRRYVSTDKITVRSAPNRGSQTGLAKLTESDIPIIRARLAAGEMQKAIAPDFGVHKGTIGAIARGTAWNHVT